MTPLILSSYTLVNSLGRGKEAIWDAVVQCRSGLTFCDFESAELNCYIGRVRGLENAPVISSLSEYDCRNNRLAQMGLEQDDFMESVARAKKRYGAHRIGVILGTSTAGIHETEKAYRARDSEGGALPLSYNYRTTHNTYSVADFVQHYLDLQGPAAVIATACSSSAKVFASAYRYLATNLCDAVIVGGVDSLCLTTLYGFSSLELISPSPCRPWDDNRDGISIGEAAGFALLEKSSGQANVALFSGYGESSDGYHMSSPHPEGKGARLAMESALANAQVAPQDIDYINLHGTASLANDSAEDKAVLEVFGETTPCSSSKGWTGHTLGAAGITEAIITVLALKNGVIPGSLNTEVVDPKLKSRIMLNNTPAALRYGMSNSIGFGGNNCSLIFQLN